MQHAVPSYSVKSLVNYLVSIGIAKSALLDLLETDETSLNNSEHTYPFEHYEQLIDYAANSKQIANIGFQFGKAFELSMWGILGHIVVCSPNLEQALVYQKRYQSLLGNTGLAEHELEGENTTMRWLSHPNASANNVELVITAWLVFAFNYTRSPDAPVSVHFTHQCLTHVEEYEALFRCPVYFNDNFNGVKLKTRSLTVPIVSANQDILNLLTSHAEHQLALKRQNASIDIIHQFIVEQLPHGVPSLELVAGHLGVSSRQLQRQFKDHETNLSQLIETIRQHLAVSYLSQTSHKLLYISTMLGYSEQSAFQRAFKRWFDITPQEYRSHPKPLNFT